MFQRRRSFYRVDCVRRKKRRLLFRLFGRKRSNRLYGFSGLIEREKGSAVKLTVSHTLSNADGKGKNDSSGKRIFLQRGEDMIKDTFFKIVESLELRVHRKMSPLFLVLSVFSVASLLISNVVATKSVALFDWEVGGLPLSIASSFVVFPFIYITSDIFSEVYGYAWSRKISWIAFFINLFMVGIFELVIAMPGVDEAYSGKFADVLGSSFGVLFASLTAYMCGDLINDLIFRRMKKNDRRRTNYTFVRRSLFSSLCGELIDSLVFLPLLYLFIGGYGTIIQSFYQLIVIIVMQGVLKTMVEIILSPLAVLIVNRVKRYEKSLTD